MSYFDLASDFTSDYGLSGLRRPAAADLRTQTDVSDLVGCLRCRPAIEAQRERATSTFITAECRRAPCQSADRSSASFGELRSQPTGRLS